VLLARSQDIWSLGITFCEMATSKKPFKNAAAAIFAVCVSKQYPALPADMSEEAVAFLGRQVGIDILCIHAYIYMRSQDGVVIINCSDE
jgi:serine/threonine protein kinase